MWVVLLGTVMVGAIPSTASAQPRPVSHARLVESSPRPFSTVPESPETIVLRFDEPVESALATMQIYDESERLVQSPEVVGGGFDYGDELTANPDLLEPGTYVVLWRVVSGDGHTVEGAFPFTIGREGTGADQQVLLDAVVSGVDSTRSLSVALGLARWLAYLGFVAIIGVLVVAAGTSLVADRRVSALWGAGALAVLVGSLAVLLLHGADAVRGDWGDVVDLGLVSATVETRLGGSLVVRVIAVSLLLVAVARRQGRAARPVTTPWANLVAVLAVVSAGTWAVSGHATSADPVPVAIALHGLHLLAVGAWIGGLVVLIVAGDGAGARTTETFSRRAGFIVPVAVVAGVGLEVLLIGDLSLIGDNAHSRTLIVKVALVAVVLVFAAAARAAFRAQRHAGVRRAMVAEATVALAVLAATAVLVDFPPDEVTRPDPAVVTLTGAGAVATVEVTSPRTGPSQIHVYLTPEGGSLQRAESIEARLRIPPDAGGAASATVPVDFAVSGSNHWTALVDFPYPGTWTLEFSVVLPGPSTVAFTGTFDVTG
jgi:copper transport protein